jgi:flagellar capping protein FliD
MREERLPIEFKELRDRIKDLIAVNRSLREEKKRFEEDILFKDRQIKELMDKYERSERSRREAYHKISSILRKLDGMRIQER